MTNAILQQDKTPLKMPEMPPMPTPPPPSHRIDGFLITLGHDLRSFGDEKGYDVMHDITQTFMYNVIHLK